MARGRPVPVWVALLAVAGVVGGVALWASRDRRASPGPAPFPPVHSAVAQAIQVSADDFIGSESCAECHAAETESWIGSTHGRAGGPPTTARVIAPFDGQTLGFLDAEVTPLIMADGDFVFVVEWMENVPDTFRVDGVVGGGHMEGGGTQGFFSAFPDGTMRFLPFDYSRQLSAWFCNARRPRPGEWRPVTAELRLAECADWPPQRVLGPSERFVGCGQCHGSQIRTEVDADAGMVRTDFTSLDVNCESCHGPAREHMELASSGAIAGGAGIGLVALGRLDEDASLAVCLRCHSQKLALRDGDLPGEDLLANYSLLLPILTDRPFTPDGRVATFGYQLNHLSSSCYLDGRMTCVSCHEPHGQGYQDTNGRPLTGRFDDGQCTSCHASKVDRVAEHTRHRPGSVGARCVSCHMPYLQHGQIGDEIPYARSDHTIPVPRPGEDEALGITSACSGCHGDRSPEQLTGQVAEWWGELKPRAALVEGVLAAESAADRIDAAPLLLRPDETHPMAQVTALSRFATRFLQPDMTGLEPSVRTALWELTASDDLDVAALALATLHLSVGELDDDRARLVASIGEREARGEHIRSRWIRVLTYIGDVYAFRRDPGTAAVVYRKALELDPDHAEALERLASVELARGDVEEAVDLYTRVIEADPVRVGAHIGLGAALEQVGDTDGAMSVYTAALEVNPGEPLLWFRSANLHLAERELEAAGVGFRRAVELDPGLVPARVGLAQVHMSEGDQDSARRELIVALEFDPENTQATALLERIAAP